MIKNNINKILADIARIKEKNKFDYDIKLIAVTKYATIDQIKEVLATGVYTLGESRVQDLIKKKEILNDPKIRWHFVGNLQTNKIKKVIELVDLIHSGSSLRQLNKINEAAKELNKKMPILLQINFAKEDTKFGFNLEELFLYLPEIFSFENLEIKGMMFIAPNIKDNVALVNYFKAIKNLCTMLKTSYNNINEISMGMSNDYLIALEEGATMVRIGSLIFN
ncbi:MAG: YggS family pyridoxal phosphate-dependent enzyme [Candidatus Margulisiibacteriota bacterium]|jgi:hypothetical protein